jgi:hypothetical protein
MFCNDVFYPNLGKFEESQYSRVGWPESLKISQNQQREESKLFGICIIVRRIIGSIIFLSDFNFRRREDGSNGNARFVRLINLVGSLIVMMTQNVSSRCRG